LGLRTLIVLVLVIGAGLGWIVREARIQRDAAAAIARAGGSVLYDWQWNNGHFIRNGKPSWPKWLLDLVGLDYLGNVVSAVVRDATDADLLQVGHLSQLKALFIEGTSQVTDRGLVHLERLTRLEVLQPGMIPIDDAGLSHISGLTRLVQLYLDDKQISDSGLKQLKGMTGLEILGLSSTTVTDAGMAHLEGMSKLRTVHLAHTRVSDAGLTHLSKLSQLTNLDLFDSRVTDFGVRKLRGALPKTQINH
jgi:hypothetical protein